MPKNYPKRRTSRYSNRHKRSGVNGGLWLLVLLLTASLILGLFYLKKQKQEVLAKHHSEFPKKEAITKAAALKLSPSLKEATPQPQFDFYTLLPKTQLSLPEEVLPNKAIPPTLPTRYVLRVASLKNMSDADRLKAELILLGFDVMLQTVNVNGASWTRVEVGPYTSLNDAQADQDRLQKNNIKSVLANVTPLKKRE
ncbi:MAG: SPOR domain-containing protein [Gammaproteobacteria bacterium]